MSFPPKTLFLGSVFFAILALGLWNLKSLLPSFSVPPALEPLLSENATPVEHTPEVFARGLEVPWGLAFTSPTRLLVAERPGRIRAIVDGSLREEPLIVFTDITTGDEEGLLGLTLHPDYATNKWVYSAYVYERENKLFMRVVRLIDEETKLRRDQVILEEVPAARFHVGTGLGFGPDGKLYVSTGDATDKNFAQNRDSLAGKFLRLNDDGSVPSDNPTAQSPVWTIGHRNSQGFDWHPDTGRMYATEHGPSGFDGPGGGDEINFLEAGKNYGWPTVHHEESREGMESPLISFTPAEAPGSAHFYTGDLIPQWKGDFFFGALRGQGLWRVRFDAANPRAIVEREKLYSEQFGRIRAITTGPDGALYFATSNRDGRGTPKEGDDKILRIVPKN